MSWVEDSATLAQLHQAADREKRPGWREYIEAVTGWTNARVNGVDTGPRPRIGDFVQPERRPVVPLERYDEPGDAREE